MTCRRKSNPSRGLRAGKGMHRPHFSRAKVAMEPFARLMESTIVLKMCYDGLWETFADGRMEYKNGKVKAFLLQNDATFEQFIARTYQVLKLSSNEYSMTVKTVWGTNCPMQPTASLPMDILDDEMVNVIICMNSDPINYGRTPIFVTTLPKVTIKAPLMPSQQKSAPLMPSTQSSAFECTFDYRSTPNYGNDFFPDTEEQRFPTTESTFGYGSTPNHGNDFFPNTEEQKFPTTEKYSLFRD
ncbi:hypothetical protein WN943_004566 [Citrus x changshan-huyou]